MFKVNNKDIRMMPDVVLVSILLTLNIFHTLFLLLTLNMEMPTGWFNFQNVIAIIFHTCFQFLSRLFLNVTIYDRIKSLNYQAY